MCIAVPMKVIEISEFSCVAEIDGVKKSASTLAMDDLEVGDYIMVHAGLAIAKLDELAAEETLRLMREIKEAVDNSDEIH